MPFVIHIINIQPVFRQKSALVSQEKIPGGIEFLPRRITIAPCQLLIVSYKTIVPIFASVKGLYPWLMENSKYSNMGLLLVRCSGDIIMTEMYIRILQ